MQLLQIGEISRDVETSMSRYDLDFRCSTDVDRCPGIIERCKISIRWPLIRGIGLWKPTGRGFVEDLIRRNQVEVALSMGKASLRVQYRTSVRLENKCSEIYTICTRTNCTRTYVRVHFTLFRYRMSIKRTSSTEINKTLIILTLLFSCRFYF